jgi:hypothetical protein
VAALAFISSCDDDLFNGLTVSPRSCLRHAGDGEGSPAPTPVRNSLQPTRCRHWHYWHAYGRPRGDVDQPHPPGLLDRSLALTLLDRTTTEDDEDGRNVKQRQLAFLFDAEMYGGSRPSDLVWLEPDDSEGLGYSRNDCCNSAVTPAETTERQQKHPGSGDGERSAVSGSSCSSTADRAMQPDAEGMMTARTALSRSAVTHNNDINNSEVFEESNDDTSADRVTVDVAAPVTAGLQQRDCCTLPTPPAFIALEGPAFEPYSACGMKPSQYRERCGETPPLPRLPHGGLARPCRGDRSVRDAPAPGLDRPVRRLRP